MKKHFEIFIGVVAPIGVDLDVVENLLRWQVEKNHNFLFKSIKISDFFHNFRSLLGSAFQSTSSMSQFNSYQQAIIKMQSGSLIRKKTACQEIMSKIAINEIDKIRSCLPTDTDKKIVVYFIRQLKREEEVKFLKSVYGDSFIQLSILDSDENRVQYLRERYEKNYIPRKCPDDECEKYTKRCIFESTNIDDQVNYIMRKDYKDDDLAFEEEWGQGVSKCFDKANYFMHAALNTPTLQDQVNRFCKLLFNGSLLQPTYDESFMFHAFGEARRSLDLSRQIGAVIVNSENEILAMGSNDVNGVGHPLSQENTFDIAAFDYTKGVNFNRKQIEILTDSVINLLIDKKLLDKAKVEDDKNIRKLMAEKLDIIGYHRTVCAEMSAIMDAARRGVSLRSSIVYSTTFPCHLCMKHLISVGVKKVVFIEPYPKSKTSVMYDDFVNQNVACACDDKVNIVPYIGVAPKSYLFAYTPDFDERKGCGLKKDSVVPKHIYHRPPESYSYQEGIAIRDLERLRNEE